MILKSNDRYWTLFCPKYWAGTGTAPAVTAISATTGPSMLRVIRVILSPPRAGVDRRPRRVRAPVRHSRDVRAGRTPAAPDGTGASPRPRNRAAPSDLA